MIKLMLSVFLLVSTMSEAKTVKVEAKNTVVIQGQVDGRILNSAAQLLSMAKTAKTINLLIESPGGSVFTGFIFMNAMQQVKSMGVTLNCIVPSYAASMAFIFFSYCDNRYAYQRSMLLFHPIGVGFQGKLNVPGVDRIQKQFSILSDELDDELRRIMGMDKSTYTSFNNSEFFWTASELKKVTSYGFITIVDKIVGLDSLFALERKQGFNNKHKNKDAETCNKCHKKPHKDKTKSIFPGNPDRYQLWKN